MPYFERPKAQPVSVIKVREQLDRSKGEKLDLIQYLEEVQQLPDKHVSQSADNHRQTLCQNTCTPVDVHRAYRFMFDIAEYIAGQGGLNAVR